MDCLWNYYFCISLMLCMFCLAAGNSWPCQHRGIWPWYCACSGNAVFWCFYDQMSKLASCAGPKIDLLHFLVWLRNSRVICLCLRLVLTAVVSYNLVDLGIVILSFKHFFSGWGLLKWRSALPGGPQSLEGLHFLLSPLILQILCFLSLLLFCGQTRCNGLLGKTHPCGLWDLE